MTVNRGRVQEEHSGLLWLKMSVFWNFILVFGIRCRYYTFEKLSTDVFLSYTSKLGIVILF